MTASRVRLVLLVWLLALLVIAGQRLDRCCRSRAGRRGWEEILWSIGFGLGFTTVGRHPRRPPAPRAGRPDHARSSGCCAIAAIGLRALAVVLDARPGADPRRGAVAAAVSLAASGTRVLMAAGGFLLVRFPSGPRA